MVVECYFVLCVVIMCHGSIDVDVIFVFSHYVRIIVCYGLVMSCYFLLFYDILFFMLFYGLFSYIV